MGELAVDEPGQSLAGGTTTVGRLASEQRAGFWTTRRAVLVVLIVASAIRLWALGTLPLMIWSDSQLYLASARELYELGTLTDYSVYRAPGYPVALALTFYVFGSSSAGILIMQHALGCLCAGLLTAIGARYSGPKLGCLAGLLFSLDPLFWIFESWAMTETLAVAALLTALARRLARAGETDRGVA